jgi:HlyD family secretion protein
MVTKRKSFGWIIVLILLAAGGFIAYTKMNVKKPLTIKTAQVKRGSITSSISSTGILQPITTVEVKSNAGGTIIELAVDEGDYVKAGQLIAKIDPSDTLTTLEQSQADYDGAVAKIDQAQKSKILQKLQSDQTIISAQQAVASANTKLSQAIEQAKLQPQLTDNSIKQAEQSLLSAKTKLAQAVEQAKLQPQLTDNSIKQAEKSLQSAKTKLAQALEQEKLQPQLTNNSIKQAEQALLSAKARLSQAQDTADIQPKLTAAAIDQAESSLSSAKSSLNQLVNSLIPQQLSSAQANFNSAKVSLDNANTNLKRQQTLFDKGYVAKSIVDDAQGKYESAKAQYDIAKSKLDTVKDQTNEDLQAAKMKVKQAESQLSNAQINKAQDKLKLKDLETAKAAVEQAETTLKNAKDNRAQDTLKSKDVDIAKDAVEQAETTLKNARDNRSQDIMKTKDVDVAQNAVDQAVINLKNARDNSVQDKLKNKDVDASRAALKQAQANLDTAIANKMQESIKAGDIIQAKSSLSRAKASVTNATTQLGYTTIVAPRDGVVMKKYVEVGSIVTGGRSSNIGSGSGVTIVDIADVSKMQVMANIDETDIARIEIGQEVDVTIDAYPDELFSGKVVKIAPQAIVDQSVTSVPVTVQMTMSDKRLKPTMNATCDFVIERRKDVLYVPVESIKETDDGVTVSMQENGQVVTRKITIGLAGSTDIEVTSGLKEGETVITSIIDPNIKKTTKPAGGNTNSGPRMF